MIDKTKFTEIISGIWYENSTGNPFSAKKHGRSLQGFNDFLKPLKNRVDGYFYINSGGYSGAWHRFVWEYFNGKIPEGMQVDHKNNIRDDNRIENLQLLSKNDNGRKRKIQKSNKVGYAGVRLRKDSNKFEARISLNKKRIVLGSFNTPEEAYKVYLDAKVNYHGAESIAPLKEKI